MKHLNINELSRKYKVETQPKKISLHLDPNNSGRMVFLQDGVWQIEPELMLKAKEDILFALGIDKKDKITKKIKGRAVILPEMVTLEFFLPWKIE